MATQWYWERDGNKHGPFTSSEMKQMAAQNQLLRSDFVWRDDSPKRVIASNVKGLFEAIPSSSTYTSSPPLPRQVPVAKSEPDSAKKTSVPPPATPVETNPFASILELESALPRVATFGRKIARFSATRRGSWITPKRLVIPIAVTVSLMLWLGFGSLSAPQGKPSVPQVIEETDQVVLLARNLAKSAKYGETIEEIKTRMHRGKDDTCLVDLRPTFKKEVSMYEGGKLNDDTNQRKKVQVIDYSPKVRLSFVQRETDKKMGLHTILIDGELTTLAANSQNKIKHIPESQKPKPQPQESKPKGSKPTSDKTDEATDEYWYDLGYKEGTTEALKEVGSYTREREMVKRNNLSETVVKSLYDQIQKRLAAYKRGGVGGPYVPFYKGKFEGYHRIASNAGIEMEKPR